MARRTSRSGPKPPTPVETTVHGDKRLNIPTADAQEFVDPSLVGIRQVALARDGGLDPQLIWRGKYPDAPADSELIADAPPIYIQEKIDPRALVEDLHRAGGRSVGEDEPSLFDTFDGLNELDAVDFYRHSANWSNRMILGDSLQVMSSLAEREALRGQVQMIYIDPPYGIKFGSNWQASTRKRDVRDGKLEDAVREAEQIKAFRDTWELGIHSYLGYLRDRLLAARELLTESGSCFVQIGDENVHLVRSLMDEVFGRENFVSQISFATTSGFAQAVGLGRMGDLILWYAMNIDSAKIRPIRRESRVDTGYSWVMLEDGSRRPATSEERADQSPLPPGARIYRNDNLRSQGAGSHNQAYQYGGKTYTPGNQLHWKASYPDGMNRLAWARRIHNAGSNLEYVRYADDSSWTAYTNIWSDTVIGGFTDEKVYVVQTTSKVVGRCMLLCTDPGDLVLDPTCGSGTAAYVAEQWGRRWITIDSSRVALALARQRLMGARYPYYLLTDSIEGRAKEAEITGRPRIGGPATDDIRQGFVYERVQHITLKSIANNPDIREGMTREEIDAAIARHADFEMLHDKPYEDRRTVRVTGRFTVESLSPYRSLSFDDGAGTREPASERAAAANPDTPSFEQTILDNLRQAGIQNGRKAERITFSVVQPMAGRYLQAIGERIPPGGAIDAPSRVAIAIGPQYGTVDAAFIKSVVREAMDADVDLLDLVCVLGFAFDPQATGVTQPDGVTIDPKDLGFAAVAAERNLGPMKVLMVRMNADLLMGEELKKTGAGNLFTVFGAPDIHVQHTHDDQLVVQLRGVDVFDPSTDEVRSDSTDKVALWMIDTDYDGESFFVRHCYFTGGNDPYKRLKTSLKADIDEEAWSTLYRTDSRAFGKPESGRIAVKVINDYGDEVMKIIEVS